jgi:hypothetical protein
MASLVASCSRIAGLGSSVALPPPFCAIATAVAAAQVLRDVEEGAAPAHAEGARHGAERGEVVGCRLGGALLQLFGRDDTGRRHDDRIGEPPFVAESTLDRQSTSARMQDLDADEAALLRLREESPDLPAGEPERLPDLVLGLVLLVVELGSPDREEFVDLVHSVLPLAFQRRQPSAHRQHSRVILLT